MDIDQFRQLLTRQGQDALRAAVGMQPVEVDFLRHLQTLSKEFPPEIAKAALETAILRKDALNKFQDAGKMYFTRDALQQASSPVVMQYRAERLKGFSTIIDLGCSIGGDTRVFAEFASVIGVDLDLLRLLMAKENLDAVGLGDRVDFTQANLLDSLPFKPTGSGTAIFFDPARRKDGRRIYSTRDYIPPLGMVDTWLANVPDLCAKISPGVNLSELTRYDAEVEFISESGELKETVLWFGSLKSARFRATVLPGEHTFIEVNTQPVEIREPRAFIYEPDPSILRAGMVQGLAEQLGASQLDETIAYLTSDTRVQTPFARSWAVEDWLPFNLKRLRAYLQDRGIGRITVKKRGSPLQPDELIKSLRLKGDQERIIFLTKLKGKPIVLIVFP